MRNVVVTIGVIILAVVIVLGISGELRKRERFDETRFLMDTVVRIVVTGKGAKEAGEAAFREMERIERLMSSFRPDSEISRLNRSAGGGPVTVGSEVLGLIEEGLRFSKITSGAFDITVGPIMHLWGFDSKAYRVPADREIRETLGRVGYEKVRVDSKARSVELMVPGMKLDLGGIAKGYATDRAGAVLRKRGIKHGLIDAGGNIVAIGTRPDGRPWRIGIRHPRDPRAGATTGPVLELVDRAAVTSGDYERYFEAGGVRYHHIFDPKTGRPAYGLMSVTILSESSTTGDALSTGVFVLGKGKGMALIESLPDVEAVIIDRNAKVFSSSGLRGPRGNPGRGRVVR